MADETSPDAPVSGDVAAIAAAAQTTAAETAGHVEAIATATELAVADIAEELGEETKWLEGKFQTHETMIRGIAETLERLPQTIATAMQGAMSEALKSLTPPPSAAEAIAEESPVVIEEKSEKPVQRKSGIRYL